MIFSRFYIFNEISWAFHSEDKNFLDRLSIDYKNYETTDRSELHFEVYIQNSNIAAIPPKRLIQGKNYLFSIGWKKRYFQFDEKLFGLEKIDKCRSLTIFGSNFIRLREVVLSYVNSVLGEFNDRKGWHRFHALGLLPSNSNGKSIIIPLNSGEGKSSFTFWVSKESSVAILSDETIITNGQFACGFFTRLALRFEPTVKNEIYKRQGQSPKYLVELSDAKIEKKKHPFVLWLPDNKWSKLKYFMTFVFGLGNAQMIEFMIRPDNILALFVIFFRRLVVGLQILTKVKIQTNWNPSELENFKKIESFK